MDALESLALALMLGGAGACIAALVIMGVLLIVPATDRVEKEVLNGLDTANAFVMYTYCACSLALATIYAGRGSWAVAAVLVGTAVLVWLNTRKHTRGTKEED